MPNSNLALIAVCLAMLVLGCASKPRAPKPEVKTDVEARLREFGAAWFAGDQAGVTASFTQRTAEELEFAHALGRLAAAQKELLKLQPSVPESIASTVQMAENVPMIALNRPWHYYAYAALRPAVGMFTKDGVVTVEMIKSGEYTLMLHETAGKWLIDPQSWAKDRPVALLTDSVRRQTMLTNNANDAIRAANWDRLRLVLQQMHQQRMVDRISESGA